MNKNLLNILIALAYLILPVNLLAAIDPNAQIILVRTDCGSLDNCFNTTEDLSAWVTDIRNPTSGAPLLVDIGPGKFGRYSCDNDDYITLRGAGVDTTTLEDRGPNGRGTVNINNCEKIQFQDVSIVGGFYAVQWGGGGSSTWVNVNIESISTIV